MDQTRIAFLRQTLQDNPDDTFARYVLPLELSKSAEPLQAWLHFEYLLTHHPKYLPTYYQAGMSLLTQGRREEAHEILAQGAEVAQRQGNFHAQSELQAALDDLTTST